MTGFGMGKLYIGSYSMVVKSSASNLKTQVTILQHYEFTCLRRFLFNKIKIGFFVLLKVFCENLHL
jgi:hypothetical protein